MGRFHRRTSTPPSLSNVPIDSDRGERVPARRSRSAGALMSVPWIRPTVVIATALAFLTAGAPAGAYNDQQHQGLVALAYKALVGAALEGGCSSPIDFAGATVTGGLTDFPGAGACPTGEQACRDLWDDFLRQNERAIRYLRSIDASLPRSNSCPELLVHTGTLGQVSFSVNPDYARGASCGVDHTLIQNLGEKQRRCSAPALLCDSRSIYQFLAPEDHVGDILGYWATEPDHDVSVTAVGVKPVFPGVGTTLQTIDEVATNALGALLIPFVCGFELLFGGDDCVNDAKALADTAVPVDEIASAIPVLFPRKDADFTGLWHFFGLPDSNSPCDDVRGMLYERAGPQTVPDALDLLILIGTELGGQTIAFNESTGPSRFNITNPGDGDPPSCRRDRADWEIAPMGHIVFSPVDNLALHGWREFTQAPGGRVAASLGWPLHALGDAVAPHHVTATTGWGHRPFEDAAEVNWNRMLYQDLADTADVRREQYHQLRRILEHAFAYRQILDDLRSGRPAGSDLNAIPVRAFVSTVAAHTYAAVTDPDGSPRWPFNPVLSVPYWVDLGLRQATIDVYRDADSVDRQRQLMERGAGAMVAFLSATGQFGAAFAPAPRCGGPGSPLFPSCGASSACTGGCCIPAVTDCPEVCSRVNCAPGSIFCTSTCSAGTSCDPSGCCVPTSSCGTARACRDANDCSAGSDCSGGCCGSPIK